MRVLMLGWEFPPVKSGGLGTACYGITNALLEKGTDVLFVMPWTNLTEHPVTHVKLRSANGTLVPEIQPADAAGEEETEYEVQKKVVRTPSTRKLIRKFLPEYKNNEISLEELQRFTSQLVIRGIRSGLKPYDTPQTYEERLTKLEEIAEKRSLTVPKIDMKEVIEEVPEAPENVNEILEMVEKKKAPAPLSKEQRVRWKEIKLHGGYGSDLMEEVYRYSLAAAQIALEEDYDVIHVHDWMTYPAGILAKQLTGKPLVAHIHALEHDRSGGGVNPIVSHIEWAGMTAADCVVAVSHYTKNEVMQYYKIPGDKIEVVHNAVNRTEDTKLHIKPHKEKRVLFMGRITYQKGPDYFVEAARLVHERMPDVHFVMAGSGDMFNRMVRRVARMRMGKIFHFPGFQTGADVERMYASCDLYVMPSVSEPFGIAPLEAMLCNVPVILSRQSGVAEVVTNALKVDFWDVQEMANKICAVLAYPKLAPQMVQNSREDLRRIRWSNAAIHLNDIYRKVLNRS